MLENRKAHYRDLDATAKSIASLSLESTNMSEAIMRTTALLYEAAKIESSEYQCESFESAYHSPITGDLEFLIARILFHFSNSNQLNWKILLRRQVGKTAPDIRIDVGQKTLAIVEVKAKAGWIQPFFSRKRKENDIARKKAGASDFDAEAMIARSRAQLAKYSEHFGIGIDQIYLFLPTLAMVHRKKHETTIDEYTQYFSETSGLPEENFILLSANRLLNLANVKGEFEPLGRFERMLRKLQTCSQDKA